MAGLYFDKLTVRQTGQHAIHRTGVEPEGMRVSVRTVHPAQLHPGAACCRTQTEYRRRIVSNAFNPGRSVGDERRFPAPIHSAYTRPNTIVGHCQRTAMRPQRP